MELLDRCRSLGADLEARDMNGLNPFISACRFQRVELAKYLLEKGANLYAVENDGFAISGHCPTNGFFGISSRSDSQTLQISSTFIIQKRASPLSTPSTEWDEKSITEALPFFIYILQICPISHRQTNQDPRPSGPPFRRSTLMVKFTRQQRSQNLRLRNSDRRTGRRGFTSAYRDGSKDKRKLSPENISHITVRGHYTRACKNFVLAKA